MKEVYDDSLKEAEDEADSMKSRYALGNATAEPFEGNNHRNHWNRYIWCFRKYSIGRF